MSKESILWEISTPEDVKSYLFGTMHVRNEHAFLHIQRALNALYKSEAFYAEMDLDEAQSRFDISQYLMPDDQKLQDIVGQKKYRKWKFIVEKSFSQNLDHFDSFYPIITTNKLAESQLENTEIHTLDYYLWNKAKELKMTMGGVESVDAQLNVLQQLNLKVQIQTLNKALRQIKKFKENIKILSQLYAEEKIHLLYKESRKSLGAFRKPMLFERNHSMTEVIFQNLNKRSFFAVGAAHLSGRFGILKLLKDKGVKLRAI